MLNKSNNSLNISKTQNLYHDNFIINLVMIVWQKTKLGVIANLLLSFYLKNKKQIKNLLNQKKISHTNTGFFK